MGKFKKQSKGSTNSRIVKKNKKKTEEVEGPAAADGKRKTGYLSAYKKAQLTYERLKAEREAEKEKQKAERERQKEENEFNKEWRKKKNQALMLRTRKGQPNLNAQIGVILEKLERDGKVEEEEEGEKMKKRRK